jgi:hypothetical protein
MFTELQLDLSEADIEAEWDTAFPAEEPPTVRRPLTPDEMAALLRDALAG